MRIADLPQLMRTKGARDIKEDTHLQKAGSKAIATAVEAGNAKGEPRNRFALCVLSNSVISCLEEPS